VSQPINIKTFPKTKKYRPAELFQLYRQRAGLTQSQLARALGLKSKRMVQYWEAGDSLPTAPNLKKLLETFFHLGLFETGQEQRAIEQLWAAVKDTFEAQSLNYVTYPILDAIWLATLIKPQPDKSEPQPQVEAAVTKPNLPAQLTSFIGREQEITELKGLFGTTRLLTLTGAGGSGKTRLALRVGLELFERFRQRVFLVELAPLSDPKLILPTICRVLGLPEQAGKSSLAGLIEYLQLHQTLLIVDNCEHLIEECAKLVHNLLSACPKLHLLITSREALGISGETTFYLPPLALPPDGQVPALARLVEYEAVQLFVERARAVNSGFELTDQNAAALVQIVRHLDGIPLALELAAARTRLLSLEQLNTRLSDRFDLLTGGSRAALPRQQTLRATLDWSYGLLSPAEQRLLNRLSIFTGSWSLEAAERVCAGNGLVARQILDLLTQLANKSLVIVELAGRQARYRFLETIRQYALEKLSAQNELEQLELSYITYFIEFAQGIDKKLKGAGDLEALQEADEAYDNIREALNRAINKPYPFLAGGLGNALGNYWPRRSYYFGEGRGYLEKVLAFDGDDERLKGYQAKSLCWAGWLALFQGDFEVARAYGEKGLVLEEALGNKEGYSLCLFLVGTIAMFQGQFTQSQTQLEECLALARQLEDKWLILCFLHMLSYLTLFQDKEYARSQKYIEEGLALSRQIDNRLFECFFMQRMGALNTELGDYVKAQAYLEQSLVLARKLADMPKLSECLNNLFDLAMRREDYVRAQAYLEETLELLREKLVWINLFPVLAEFMVLVVRQTAGLKAGVQPTDTDPLLKVAYLGGAVTTLLVKQKAQLYQPLQDYYEEGLEIARRELGEAAFAAAFGGGQAISLEDALQMVLALQLPG
jgi:predicted ATPase/transcriptional regulator with XRE-family HTH domain